MTRGSERPRGKAGFEAQLRIGDRASPHNDAQRRVITVDSALPRSIY
jgi:hypothetical protein